MWLIFTIFGCLLLAVVNILDKFIVTKTVKPVVFVFYSTIFALPIFLLVPFGVHFLNTETDWLLAILSGLTFGVALWFMYKGFAESEISHVGPLVGASISLFVFILSQLFLDEKITSVQIGAIFILIVGSLLISLEKSKMHSGWHKGMFWGVAAGLLFAVSNVATKYIYTHYDFYSGLVWTRGFTGLCGLVVLFFPSVYKSFFSTQPKHFVSHKSLRKIFLVVINKALGVVGVVFIQYATAVGSVSLVNALTGVQYGFLVLLVALLSKYRPRIFRESYSKFEIFQEMFAVILISIGVALLI
jgi:drug/metabolite transporter (DMT)-like permease